MIFILNEKQAGKIFNNYDDVAAFSLGKAKGYSDAKISLSYKKLGFLPDNDTMNAVLNGDMKASKVIKAAVKACKNPNVKGGNSIALGMTQLVGMIKDANDIPAGMRKKEYNKYLKKHGPNILVFVLDEEDTARSKFMAKYLSALFDVYGYKPITNKKVVKKLFAKGKGKKKNRQRKINDRVRDFIANNKSEKAGIVMSKQGRRLYQITKLYYSNEFLQQSLAETAKVAKLGESGARKLAKHLATCFSGLNVKELDKISLKNEKPYKELRKKNIRAVNAYKELRDILAEMNPDAQKLPKVVFGCTKKSKKKGDPKPKMNIKKFIKFFTKSDNRPLLRLVFAHIACKMFGVEVGSSEYNRNISDSISGSLSSEFVKKYVATAKAHAKAKATTGNAAE